MGFETGPIEMFGIALAKINVKTEVFSLDLADEPRFQ